MNHYNRNLATIMEVKSDTVVQQTSHLRGPVFHSMKLRQRVQLIHCPSSFMWLGWITLRVIAVMVSILIYHLIWITSDLSCGQINNNSQFFLFISFLQACIDSNVHMNNFIMCIIYYIIHQHVLNNGSYTNISILQLPFASSHHPPSNPRTGAQKAARMA